MNEQEIQESAKAVAAELIVVANQSDLGEARETVLAAIIGERMLPFGTDATVKQSMEHASIVLKIITETLAKALDELTELDRLADGDG